MGKEVEITDASFEQEVIQSDVPVLIDFWAPWCGPCRMVAPIVEEIASDYDGKIKVGKINTDDNQKVAAQFGIRSIPTLALFKGGRQLASQPGAMSLSQLLQWIDTQL